VFDISQQVSFYLAKPNLETTHKFSDVYNRKLTVKYDDLHELSFSIPYKISLNHEMVDNPAIALIRERFVVKIVLNQFEEYFVINQITKSDNVTSGFDVEDLTIHCFHLPYELHYKRFKGYSCTSYNCLQVTNDALKDTSWKVGYINPSFNIHYRSFDISSGNVTDFLNEISKSFNAIKTYDTKNRLVNFCTQDEISQYKGLNIRNGQYIIGISDDINIDNMATRLYVYGNNDLTINSISPNGQSYIEDFSYFLYPYEEDSNGNVVSSSNFMSDALCKTILAHGKLIEQNQTTLSGYFNQISTLQQDITTINNQITTDNENLKIANDNLNIALQNGLDTTSINAQIASLNADLVTQNTALTDKNNQITSIQNQIAELKKTLILENYLDNTNQSYLLEELKYYIIESEFTDSNIIDAIDLYNEGLSQLATLNSPPVAITINLVDFLDIIEESYNWNRLNIGDLVNIYHPTLGIKIQTKITQIEYDFEQQSITLGISNSTRLLNDWEKFVKNSYNINKVSTDYSNRKIDWQKTSYNFNTRNDRISDKPVDPTFNNNATDITHVKNDDGSVTLTVNWNYPTDMTINANNIDGFDIILYSSKNVENIDLSTYGDSIINVSADLRKCTIPSVPANLFYYIGIRVYRDVDNDIDSSGIIMSNIVTSTSNYPYQPEKIVDVQGKLNGVVYSVSPDPPSNPSINDIWTDTTTNQRKIYTSNGWETANAGDATSVSGYIPSVSADANKIVVRDSNGNVPGSVTGSASYLNGKPDTAFAQLDSNGKISTTNLPINYSFGSYTGDGTSLRKIALPFTARFVRVYSTNTSDISLYITSTTGGYKLNTSTSSLVLVGMADGTPYAQFGKLTTDGFVVGQDTTNYYGNKNGILYWFEAFS
jgi:phage minor structural protein